MFHGIIIRFNNASPMTFSCGAFLERRYNMGKCLKNKNYKSTTQFYNNSVQNVLATNTVSNPLVLNIGTITCDTGCSLSENTNSVIVNSCGTYEISAEVTVLVGVAGSVSVAVSENGVILPETVRTLDLAAAANTVIPLETVHFVQTNCVSDGVLRVIAYSDGTATADVQSVSGNVVKLA